MNRNKIISKGLIDKNNYIFIIEMKSFKLNLKINYVNYHYDKKYTSIAMVLIVHKITKL